MNRRVSIKQVMLCCFVFVMGLAGCKTKNTETLNWTPNEELRKHIVRVVQDADRQQAMLNILDSFNKEMKSDIEAVKSKRAEILKANADYDTTRAELERMYGVLNAKTGDIADAVRRHTLQLRSHCSQDEWEKIFAHVKPMGIKYY